MNMNMNMIMQQAQKMQKELKKAQEEIESKTFTSKKDLVEVEMYGNKQIKSIKISKDITSDDVEILEDMITLAVNDTINQINKETESKLGKFSGGLPGLF